MWKEKKRSPKNKGRRETSGMEGDRVNVGGRKQEDCQLF